MGYLKFALIVAVIISAVAGTRLFNRHCLKRFGHTFFTVRSFWLAAIAINLIWWGIYFWAQAAVHHTPMTDGLMLMALGLAATVWLIYENVRDTDLLHGLGGSSLQLVLFFPLALCSFPLLVVAMVVMVIASYKAGPAWLIDR